jgi:hypothetical protein
MRKITKRQLRLGELVALAAVAMLAAVAAVSLGGYTPVRASADEGPPAYTVIDYGAITEADEYEKIFGQFTVAQALLALQDGPAFQPFTVSFTEMVGFAGYFNFNTGGGQAEFSIRTSKSVADDTNLVAGSKCLLTSDELSSSGHNGVGEAWFGIEFNSPVRLEIGTPYYLTVRVSDIPGDAAMHWYGTTAQGATAGGSNSSVWAGESNLQDKYCFPAFKIYGESPFSFIDASDEAVYTAYSVMEQSAVDIPLVGLQNGPAFQKFKPATGIISGIAGYFHFNISAGAIDFSIRSSMSAADDTNVVGDIISLSAIDCSSVAASAGWLRMAFDNPVTVTPGVDYYLTVHARNTVGEPVHWYGTNVPGDTQGNTRYVLWTYENGAYGEKFDCYSAFKVYGSPVVTFASADNSADWDGGGRTPAAVDFDTPNDASAVFVESDHKISLSYTAGSDFDLTDTQIGNGAAALNVWIFFSRKDVLDADAAYAVLRDSDGDAANQYEWALDEDFFSVLKPAMWNRVEFLIADAKKTGTVDLSKLGYFGVFEDGAAFADGVTVKLALTDVTLIMAAAADWDADEYVRITDTAFAGRFLDMPAVSAQGITVDALAQITQEMDMYQTPNATVIKASKYNPTVYTANYTYFEPIDISEYDDVYGAFYCYVWIKDADALTAEAGHQCIKIGSSTEDFFSFAIAGDKFVSGWNKITAKLSAAQIQGAPDKANMRCLSTQNVIKEADDGFAVYIGEFGFLEYEFEEQVTMSVETVPYLVDLTVTGTQEKTAYLTGDTLDLTGLTVCAVFSDSTQVDVTATLADIVLYTAGATSAELRFTASGITKKVDVTGFTVGDAYAVENITAVEIAQSDYKKVYYVGEALSVNKLSLSVTYGNGQTKSRAVTASMVTGFDTSVPTESRTVTITYEGFTATYTIRVKALVIESIELAEGEYKTNYRQGEALSVEGLKIIVSYNNGSNEVVDVTAEMIAGFNGDAAGEQTLTVTYGEKTVEFKVTVEAGAKKGCGKGCGSAAYGYVPFVFVFIAIVCAGVLFGSRKKKPE